VDAEPELAYGDIFSIAEAGLRTADGVSAWPAVREAAKRLR
jgi:hypothetical protein